MPNTKSAIRRVRRVKKQTQVNRIRKSKYKNAVKQMELLLKTKEKEKAKKYFSKFQSILMQVAKSGIISRNTASRKISRISKKIIDLSKILDKLDSILYYSMTGSGSAFFVICDTKKSLLNIQKMIKKQKKAFWTTIAKTI